MIRKAEMLERAELYRYMARQTLNLKWRVEFNERAERYEVAADAFRRKVPHRDEAISKKPD